MLSRNKIAPGVAALSFMLVVAGCSDNLARRDTIAFSAGNSQAANRAIQVIDPYPRRSFLRGQPTNGEKAQQAMRRYLTPDTTPGLTPGGAQGGAQGAVGGGATQ